MPVAAKPPGATDVAAPPLGPRPQSRRIRSCVESALSLMLTAWYAAPCTPEPPAPPRTVVLDKDGVRLGSDGQPLRLPRKERAALKLQQDEAAAREALTALGLDPRKGQLATFSPKRLREFAEALDDEKRYCYRVAPEAAETLATELLLRCNPPATSPAQRFQVTLPWGSKKGNSQPGSVRMRLRFPPTLPGAPRRAGRLLLALECAERRGVRFIEVTGAKTTVTEDTCLSLLCKEGCILLQSPVGIDKEPAGAAERLRWSWLLAINAGLWKAGTAPCLLDQSAVMLPWHAKITFETE